MDNFNHGDTLFNTLNIQASLIANGFVPQRMIDKVKLKIFFYKSN